eukprot:Platyproteum_vivax@DN14746_c0_g1_i1.p1
MVYFLGSLSTTFVLETFMAGKDRSQNNLAADFIGQIIIRVMKKTTRPTLGVLPTGDAPTARIQQPQRSGYFNPTILIKNQPSIQFKLTLHEMGEDKKLHNKHFAVFIYGDSALDTKLHTIHYYLKQVQEQLKKSFSEVEYYEPDMNIQALILPRVLIELSTVPAAGDVLTYKFHGDEVNE